MMDALRAHVPTLTITGVTAGGDAPYWHQAEDTYDKIDPEVLARTYEFVWCIIQELDGQEITARTKYSPPPVERGKPLQPVAQ